MWWHLSKIGKNQGDREEGGGMNEGGILIVDDERNIRVTLSRALEDMGLEIAEAADGEDALSQLAGKRFKVLLLDLMLPGIDGMEVLRRVRKMRPVMPVIIMTAHGTIEYAVEAMKLGAVDFIEKPFSPDEIRSLVSHVAQSVKNTEQLEPDYALLLWFSRQSVVEGNLEAALEHAQRATSLRPESAEAFNLLGAVLEIRGERSESQKNYRAALTLNPSYGPAIKNLERSTSWRPLRKGRILLGEEETEKG
jgi:DNA-binding response OmpR family regulator